MPCPSETLLIPQLPEPVACAALESLQEATVVADPQGVVLLWNAAAVRLCGRPAGELLGRPLVELPMLSGQQDEVRAALQTALGADRYLGDWTLGDQAGGAVAVQVSASALRGSAGELLGVLLQLTERIEADQALRASEEWFRNIAATSQEGIWALDAAGRTLFTNTELTHLLGVPSAVLKATTPPELLSPDDPESLRRAVTSRASSGRPERHELSYRHPDGTERRLDIAVSVLAHAGGAGWLAMVSDVTEVRRIEAELRHRALYDELTGLPNRALLLDRLDRALARCREEPECGPVAVLLLDLDHFKLVNDTWGHGSGDDLLRTVAGRLSAALRPSDTVARFGGDEFVVVCEGLEQGEVQALADSLIAAVGERVEVDGNATYVGASIGIALSPPDRPEDLVRFADAAMYDAKARGRNRAQVFDVELADAAADRLVLGNELREALAGDGLVLQYQPIVELQSGSVVSVEALARWVHPLRGQIPPSHFVRVAELTGQAPALDAWAMRQACRDAGRLRSGLGPDVRVAVNISAANLEKNRLEEQLLAALAAGALPAQALVLEVTENTLMAQPEVGRAALERLRAHGVSVAIDDFGTGYSSLAYLTQLPVQMMKIDRSFVLSLTEDPDAFAITAAIVDLGRTLGLRTIAEGVETPEQLALLRKLGCWAAQGFLWCPALSVPELVATVNALPSRRFPVSADAPADAPAGRRRREPVTAEHGLLELQRMHREGASLATIAAALNQAGFHTPQGLRWHRSSVARVISELAYPQLRNART